MKRPMLICGVTAVVVSSLLMISQKLLLPLLLASALVFVFYFIKPLKLRPYIIIPFCCICTALLCTSFAIYNHTQISPHLKYDGAVSDISGKIISVVNEDEFGSDFIIKADNINGEKVNVKIKINVPKNTNFTTYNYISIKNALIKTDKNEENKIDSTSFSQDSFLYCEATNITVLWQCEKTPYYYCVALRQAICEKINRFPPHSSGGLLKGMLFGDKADIDYATTKAFRNSGIAHLLAVSGLHTSLWCGIIIALLSSLKIPEKYRNIICMAFLLCFMIISAFTPSVIRASLMMLIILLAPFFKTRPDSFNSLGLAVSLLLFMNPYMITSISFQLSCISTLGVLFSLPYAERLHSVVKEKTDKHVSTFINSILSTIVISIFCMVFTTPISAFHFGVASLLSPIANLLCIQLSFYGLISGFCSVLLSFVPFSFTKDIAITFFKITDFILELVIFLSKKTSDVTFCTIPIHKEWLIVGITLSSVVALVGYGFYKTNKERKRAIISVAACFVLFISSILSPLAHTNYKNEITIVSSGNNLQLVIRSSTHYAYITNISSHYAGICYDYLPKATCETLDYYIAPYMTSSAVRNIKKINENYSPMQTNINPFIRDEMNRCEIPLAPNTLLSPYGTFSLSDEITFQIVDTSYIEYVIIRSDKTDVFVLLHGKADISSIKNSEDFDIMVFNNCIPTDTLNAKTVIVSSDTDILSSEGYTSHIGEIPVHYTAINGDITLTI